MLIVFFHASVYNYANINKIDFSNPPIVVVIISFLVLWGGMLIFYSGVLNTIMFLKRKMNGLKFIFIAGAIYIFIHYILNIFLGRWANDFVYNKPDMTVVAGSIRNLEFTFPHISKWFEGSSISTIAINLVIIGYLLYLLRNTKDKTKFLVFGISGTLIMFLSFVRIYFYDMSNISVLQHNYFVSFLLGFLVANPYPLLPYLAYGFFAAIIGIMIYSNKEVLLKKVMIPIGSLFLVYGIIGCLNFEKTISKADWFWYFKTHFELGIFILVLIAFFFMFKNKKLKSVTFIKNFSLISLTIYLLETAVSEIFGKIALFFFPMWNQSINGCLIFGAINVLFWCIVLIIWSKSKFKYSLEYFWVMFFNKIGKKSTKLRL